MIVALAKALLLNLAINVVLLRGFVKIGTHESVLLTSKGTSPVKFYRASRGLFRLVGIMSGSRRCFCKIITCSRLLTERIHDSTVFLAQL